MSTSIRPTDIVTLEGETICRYELPKSEEPALWVDTSDKGYSVKWEISDEFGVEEYRDFLTSLDPCIGTKEAVASFEENEKRVNGLLDEITDFEDYPSECTYLRAETSTFDIDWLKDSYVNRIIFSADHSNRDILRDMFSSFVEEYGEHLLDRPYNVALEEAEQVIEQDCGLGLEGNGLEL